MRGSTFAWMILVPALLSACGPAATDSEDGGGGDGGSAGSGGTGGRGGGGGEAPGEAPRLTAFAARISGRSGDDLTLDLAGTDADEDTQALWLRLTDAGDRPIVAFDSDGDGVLDSGEGLVALPAEARGSRDIAATLTLGGLFRTAKVAAALVDAAGHASDEETATVQAQPVRSSGEGCDPTTIADRCESTLTCRGEPATCHPPEAPEVTRAAYLRNGDGAVLLVEGNEPDDDLNRMEIGFLDASGNPVAIDMDTDGTPESTRYEFDASNSCSAGRFFALYVADGSFVQRVNRLEFVPKDAGGRAGPPVEAQLADPVIRNRGQSCDPHGFDQCKEGTLCAPGVPDADNRCTTASTVRNDACGDAPLLDPAAGFTTVGGTAAGLSLWDPPAGCTAGEPRGMPEGIARLHLGSAASSLRVSTIGAGTGFDTILYLLLDCTATEPIACNDDYNGSRGSVLELSSVPAGDYLIVVDGFDRRGGAWQLSVETR